jgi:tRNA threonylcarbamoyl adenosine modification protein YeaZ
VSLVLLVDSVHTELAVALIGEDSARFKIFSVQKQHDRNVNRLVRELMADSGVGFADLTGYAVVVGPGSWTGCRVGVAAVKGYAMAHPKPTVAINSLDAIGDPAAIRSNLDNYYIKRGSKYSCEKLTTTEGFATIEGIGIECYRSRLISLAKSGKRIDAKDLQPFYLTEFVVG